jgi:hypothetical protein
VYLGDPRETTSRRGLKLEALVWPRNVVGVRTLLELVNVDAIVSLGLSFSFLLSVVAVSSFHFFVTYKDVFIQEK